MLLSQDSFGGDKCVFLDVTATFLASEAKLEKSSMNLLHVVSHLDVESSGPSYSVPNLSAALSRQEQKVTLVSLDRGRDIFRPTGVESLAFPQAAFPQKLGSSPAMRKWMRSTRRRLPHIIHSHGLWMMPNFIPRGQRAI